MNSMNTLIEIDGHFLGIKFEVGNDESQGNSAYPAKLTIRADQLLDDKCGPHRGNYCDTSFVGEMEFQEFRSAIHFLSTALTGIYGEPPLREYSFKVERNDQGTPQTFRIARR
jgi:hypothetical protein